VRRLVVAALAIAGFGLPCAAAPAAVPVTLNGGQVSVLGKGLASPTAFAFAGNRVFASAGGKLVGPGASSGGGVYILRGGRAVRIKGMPAAFGLAWKGSTLYAATGKRLTAWSGWNGTTFTRSKVLYTGPAHFTGFNGLAFGPDGRLYTGVYAGALDWERATTPYANDVLSFKPDGSGLRIVATGMRQPWQFAFVPGSGAPYVTDLGQDFHAVDPPDFLFSIHQGDHFGFPDCNWTPETDVACAQSTRPFASFPPHSSPMGIAAVGGSLFVALYGQRNVVRLATPAAAPTPVLTGFPGRPIALGAHAGRLYVGDSSGTLYTTPLASVTPT
jgi:glucose/arabinose dehydrogenase